MFDHHLCNVLEMLTLVNRSEVEARSLGVKPGDRTTPVASPAEGKNIESDDETISPPPNHHLGPTMRR